MSPEPLPLIVAEPFSCRWALLPGLAQRLYRELGIAFDLATAAASSGQLPEKFDAGETSSGQLHRLEHGEQIIELSAIDWQSGGYSAQGGGVGVSWGWQRDGRITGLPDGGALSLSSDGGADDLVSCRWVGAAHAEAWGRALIDYVAFLPRVLAWRRELGPGAHVELTLDLELAVLREYPVDPEELISRPARYPAMSLTELARGSLRSDLDRLLGAAITAEVLDAGARLLGSRFSRMG